MNDCTGKVLEMLVGARVSSARQELHLLCTVPSDQTLQGVLLGLSGYVLIFMKEQDLL